MYTSIWWYLRVLPVLHRPEVVDIDACLSIRAGTRSGSDAFAGLRLFSGLSMPGAVDSMSGIEGTCF